MKVGPLKIFSYIDQQIVSCIEKQGQLYSATTDVPVSDTKKARPSRLLY